MPHTAVVIDADADVRAVVATALRRFGIKVIAEAASREEAVALAAELQPAVLVLDHRLPDGSGLDVIPSIRAVANGVCVVLFAVDDPTIDLDDDRRLPDVLIRTLSDLTAMPAAVDRCLAERASLPG